MTTTNTTSKPAAVVKTAEPAPLKVRGVALEQGKGKPAYVLPMAKATAARKHIAAALDADKRAALLVKSAGEAYRMALVDIGAITAEGKWDAGFTVPLLSIAKALTPNDGGYAFPSGGSKTDAMPKAEQDYIDAVHKVNTGLRRAAGDAGKMASKGASKGTSAASTGKGASKGGGAVKGTAPAMPAATVATIGKVIDTVAQKGTKAATDRMAKSVAAWLSGMATTKSVGNMSADAAALLLAACRAYVDSCEPVKVTTEAKAS